MGSLNVLEKIEKICSEGCLYTNMPRRNSNSQSKDKPRRKPQQNTGSNGGVKPQRPSSPTPSTQSAPNQFTHTRTQYLSNNLIGQTVDVQVSDGAWYQGIYTAPPINKGFCAILAYSKKIEQIDSNGQKKFAMEVIQRKVIKPDEIVQVLAKEIIFVGDMTNTNSNARDTFKTDSAISRSGEIKERELQPWKPDDNVPQPVWSPTSDNSSWDQFSTNEKLFGVKTSFNEDMYTTKLDKSSEFYKQNESRAAKLANEISKESNSNVHIANDRGIDLEMDEEDLYGAVIRNPSSIPSEGKYIPPAKKKQAAMAEKSKTMVEPASQESKITSEPKTATQLKPDNTQTSTNVGGSSAQDSETPTTETRNHINTLYCEAMQNRLLVDPSKVDPNWKSTTGSYLSTEEETPVAYYPQYVVPPMVPPMGYSPYPQIPYGYPMMQGQPPYPGFPMMMGMPPPQ